MITVYGIKNCDSVKKARKWLDENGYDHYFHDFRQDGLDSKLLSEWTDKLGWEKIVNKRSTTWRNLSEQEKNISNSQQAIKLLSNNLTLIKRPVIQSEKKLLVGFYPSDYSDL